MLLNRAIATVSIPDSSAAQVALTGASASIPISSMKIGSTYRFWASGVCVTNNGVAVNMVFRLNAGSAGATTVTSQSSALASVASGAWYYHGILICNAIGAGTTQMYGSIGGVNSAGTADVDRELKASAQLTGQDSTAIQIVALYMNWASAANLGNSYTLHTAYIEKLN